MKTYKNKLKKHEFGSTVGAEMREGYEVSVSTVKM